jgi:hypothetical protein
VRRLVFIALNVISLMGFLYLLVAPQNKYEWMREFDSALSHSAIEDASGSSVVVGALTVAVIWVCQTGVAWSAQGSRRALVPWMISGLAGAVWLVKFS